MPEPAQPQFVSPLRYPGGKRKVTNFLKLLMLANKLVGHEYAELYAGGASVALSLLFGEFASHIHINDLNRSVHAFWEATLNHHTDLCRRILNAEITMDEWERQRAVQASDSPDLLDLAFSTFFLNRTNRSGIINGGVIGGKAQTGTWKLDARFNRAELVRRIEKIARFRSRITLTRLDAAEFLRTGRTRLPSSTLVYLDPPYYVKGEGLYEHFYQHEDHVAIAGLVQNLHHPWVVSYDASPEILSMYAAVVPLNYGLHYSATERYVGKEVMFFSRGLQIPNVDSPANIPIQTVNIALRKLLAA
ncbi:MAG: DNA adenine methylase [Actinomycetota bacterium]